MIKDKNNSGITLIVLIITLIMLIILTAIAINAVVGDDGIISMAEETKEQAINEGEQALDRLNQIYDKTRSQTVVRNYDAELELERYRTTIAETLRNLGAEDVTGYESAEEIATIIKQLVEGN